MSLFCRLFPGRRNPQAPEGAFLLRYPGSGALFHATDIRPFPTDKKHLPCGDEIRSFPQVSAFPDTPQLFSVLEICPFFHSGDRLRMGPFLSFGNRSPQGPGRTLLISSVIRSGPSRAGLPPGAGLDLRLFSSYLYIPGHTAVLSCQKEHKKDRDPPCQSFPVSLTTKYRTVTGRDVPL